RMVLRRLEFFVVTLWAALTINFVIPRLMPGGPTEAMLVRFRGQVNPQTLRAIEVAFGQSSGGNVFSDYLEYLDNLAHGDFGISRLCCPVPVQDVMANALPGTIGLIGVSTVLAFAIGTLLGMLAAWRRGGFTDNVVLPLSIVSSAFPFFWIGLIAIYVFS